MLRNELINQVGDTRECYLCLSSINLRDRTYHESCATLNAIPETTKIQAILDAAKNWAIDKDFPFSLDADNHLFTAVKKMEEQDES